MREIMAHKWLRAEDNTATATTTDTTTQAAPLTTLDERELRERTLAEIKDKYSAEMSVDAVVKVNIHTHISEMCISKTQKDDDSKN